MRLTANDSGSPATTSIQKLAIGYATLFFLLVGLGHVADRIPPGHFPILLSPPHIYDNLLYVFSGLWALTAGIVSQRASLLCFRLFGVVYFTYALVGIVTGAGCLDSGEVTLSLRSFNDIEFSQRLLASTPHLLLGALGLATGFLRATRPTRQQARA